MTLLIHKTELIVYYEALWSDLCHVCVEKKKRMKSPGQRGEEASCSRAGIPAGWRWSGAPCSWGWWSGAAPPRRVWTSRRRRRERCSQTAEDATHTHTVLHCITLLCVCVWKRERETHWASRAGLVVMMALLTVVKCIVGREHAESDRHRLPLPVTTLITLLLLYSCIAHTHTQTQNHMKHTHNI